MKIEKPQTRLFTILALCVGIVLSWLLLLFAAPYEVSQKVCTIRNAMEQDGRIIHAGGFLQKSDGTQVNYTNSLEALENCYRNGNRFCEIDLLETSDGMLICGHGDENELVFGTGLPPTASGKDFLNSRIYGEFTPLSSDGLAAFMREHPDIYVITDVKTDNLRVCRCLKEEYPDLTDRFIVQIQLPEEYDELKALGFLYITYPTFKTPDEQRGLLQLAAFVRQHELLALILPNGYYLPDFKLLLAETIIGTPFILHTLNNEREIRYYRNTRLAKTVYTDQPVRDGNGVIW